MTTEEILAHKDLLNARCDNSTSKFNDYVKDHRNSMGLIDDEIKQTEKYRVLSWQAQMDIGMSRAFNKEFANRPDVKKATVARRFNA